MGATNHTANLSLPQFVDADKPTWRGDINGAFSDIDGKIGTIDGDLTARITQAQGDVRYGRLAVANVFTAKQTVQSLQFTTDADAMVLSDTLGTHSSRRLNLQPNNVASSTKNVSLELVPGALVDSADNIPSQIQLFNKTGTNYERFDFSCVNNQYIIDSTYNGTGIARNIYITMGGSVSNEIAGVNALVCYSDASVDLPGSTFSQDGETWCINRTRIADPTNTGQSRLILDTRTGTPTSVTADNTIIELRRGGDQKWYFGLNAAGDNTDSFDFLNTTGRVFSIAQSNGGLRWSAVGGAIDTQIDRGAAGGRLTLNGAIDTRFTINSNQSTAGAVAIVEYQRGGSTKWQVGLNYAEGTTNDTFDFYSGGLALQLTSTHSVLIGDNAPATTATDGFPYVPVMAGTPTGVPTAKTGFVPMVMDSTGVKVWFYVGGSWKGVVVA